MVADETNSAKNRRRTRVREIDFMRVEDASIQDALSPFEMEVKNKIAGEMPLRREALDAEELRIKERLARVFKGKLKKLISKGVLTKRQREFYDLFYVGKLSDRDIAKKMGVSRVRVRKLRWSLKEALKRALQIEKKLEAINSRIKHSHLTKRQKLVWNYYYKQKLPMSEIALKTGRTHMAVFLVLQNVMKKNFKHKNL